MKNKLLLCLAHLAITTLTAILLVASIEWFMSNISYQKKILKEKTQTLQNEVNAPNYFKLHGITTLTPQVITNYDQKFGTNLRSKIIQQISNTSAIKDTLDKKKNDYFNKTTEANQSSSYQAQSPTAYMRPPEMRSSATWSPPQQSSVSQPVTIPSQINETVSLSILKESVSQSTAELETLQNKGIWNYILSLNIIIPGTGMSLIGLFFFTMLKKIFEDCYPGIKWLAKQMWNLLFFKKNRAKKTKRNDR